MLQLSIDSHASLDRQEENETMLAMNQYDRNSERKDYRIHQRHTMCSAWETIINWKWSIGSPWLCEILFLQINEVFEVLLTRDRKETSTLYIVTANI